MNCRPGDLAIMVISVAGNEGKIVRCLRLATREDVDRAFFRVDMGPAWLLDRPLPTRLGFTASLAFDCCLRPIRDPGDDATDETLLWIPSPSKQKESA